MKTPVKQSPIKSSIISYLMLLATLMFIGCATPNRLVYSSGFSFANYDFVMIGKPDSNNTTTTLYGMDVEFANLLSSYNIRVVGDKEYLQLPSDTQKRTLFARIAITAGGERILLTASFDDAVTGKTGASITTYSKGDIFDPKARTKVFEDASVTIIKALRQDKGLVITNEKKQ